jgi:predicted nucleic acid-binding protein
VITLLDNTVISNFAVVERPKLLRIAFDDRLATSRQAFDELTAGVRRGKLPDLDWSWLSIWSLQAEERLRYNQFLSDLNEGEAACLAMAVHRGCRIVTDDRDARELAHQLRIPLTGTLGTLMTLVDVGSLYIEEADVLLSRMIAARFRSPVLSLRELL